MFREVSLNLMCMASLQCLLLFDDDNNNNNNNNVDQKHLCYQKYLLNLRSDTSIEHVYNIVGHNLVIIRVQFLPKLRHLSERTLWVLVAKLLSSGLIFYFYPEL